jgi:RNA polymerase sigma-70 factor (ECF subfamily)
MTKNVISELAVGAVNLFKKQDHHRFCESLYKQHAEKLLAYLRRLYGSGPPDPEDTLSEVFLKFSQQKNIEAIQNPKSYLYKMAINHSLNQINQHNTAKKYVESVLSSTEQAIVYGPDQILEDHDKLHRVGKAIENLPKKQKEIFVRSRLQGQTFAQISSETGWSLADISRQLKCALELLMTQHVSNDERDGGDE